jgi:hypothetical protein
VKLGLGLAYLGIDNKHDVRHHYHSPHILVVTTA